MADADTLETFIESTLSGVNTSLPGVIVSYDPSSNRAVVRPSLPKRNADGSELPAPTIHSVPVVWPASGIGGKQASFTFPIKAGDGVQLHFSQRSLEGWLSGNNAAPDDPRQFDLSDAIATPGLNASGVSGDPEDVVLKFDATEFRLQPDGTVIIKNAASKLTMSPAGVFTLDGTQTIINTPLLVNGPISVQTGVGGAGNVGVVGVINITGELNLNGIAYSTHRHGNGNDGSDTGGPIG